MGLSRFGGLWLSGGSAIWNLTTTPVALNTWESVSDGAGGIDAQLNNGQIIIRVPGFYAAYCSLSFTIEAGSVLYAEFWVNGALGNQFRAHAEGIASGGPMNLFILGAANLKENDVVQVYVYSDQAGGTDFVHVDGQFGLISL